MLVLKVSFSRRRPAGRKKGRQIDREGRTVKCVCALHKYLSVEVVINVEFSEDEKEERIARVGEQVRNIFMGGADSCGRGIQVDVKKF